MPSVDSQTFCCPRCGEGLCAGAEESASSGVAAAETPQPPADLPWFDSWEIDEQLRKIERVLQNAPETCGESASAASSDPLRVDRAHAAPAAWHMPSSASQQKKRETLVDRASPGFVTWFVLAIGTTCFVCGGVLLGWSLSTGREELWTAGLPMALVGQVLLLLGLIVQLERLWHENRSAAAKLENVDEQLHELKSAATFLGAVQGPASSAFYSHFTNGASPHVLLTDLKSQLDLLAMKIARDPP